MDALFQNLSEQGGVLGTLLALSIILIGLLGRLLLAEKDKRIQDANTYREDLVEPIGKIGRGFADLADRIERFTRGRNDS